jgi:hypothetical protein
MDTEFDSATGVKKTKVFVADVVKDEAMRKSQPPGTRIGDWDQNTKVHLLDDSGKVLEVGTDWPAYPNGIEWSNCSKDTRLYWIRQGPTVGRHPLAQLWYSAFERPSLIRPAQWSVGQPVRFTTQANCDRYLTNCSYSPLMDDRILFYVRVDRAAAGLQVPDWKEFGEAWWTWCRGLTKATLRCRNTPPITSWRSSHRSPARSGRSTARMRCSSARSRTAPTSGCGGTTCARALRRTTPDARR